MACLEQNGQVRYLNGLDETAPEVKTISDPEKKEARIKEIRSIVAYLEFEKHYVKLDIDDEHFWNKVQTYKPNNREFWSGIFMEYNNNDVVLDPLKKSEDLIKILAIESGGFPSVAKSFEDCKNGDRNRKWFLDRQIDTAESKVSVSKVKNKALSILNGLSENKPRKLFYIAKLADSNSMQYKNSTLQNIIYDNMDEFINGLGTESNIKAAANRFMELSKLNMQELKIRSMVKDATFYKIIIVKGDGLLYLAKDNVMLGRNASEIYEYLVNPMNEEVLRKLQNKVEGLWSA